MCVLQFPRDVNSKMCHDYSTRRCYRPVQNFHFKTVYTVFRICFPFSHYIEMLYVLAVLYWRSFCIRMDWHLIKISAKSYLCPAQRGIGPMETAASGWAAMSGGVIQENYIKKHYRVFNNSCTVTIQCCGHIRLHN